MSDDVPSVPGFRLERDVLTDQWIGTSPSGFVIRGWTQYELAAARWALWRQILDNFRTALAEVYPPNSSTQTPPRPDWERPRGDPGRPGMAGTRRPDGAPAASPVPLAPGRREGNAGGLGR